MVPQQDHPPSGLTLSTLQGPMKLRSRSSLLAALLLSVGLLAGDAAAGVTGVPGINEGGTYLKLPLCTSCEGGGSGFDFDDDD